MGALGGLWEQKKGHSLRTEADVYRVWWCISGRHFEFFWHLGQNWCVFSMFVARILLERLAGLALVVWNLKTCIGGEMVFEIKKHSQIVGICCIQVHCLMLVDGLGANVHEFWYLGKGFGI